MVLVSISRKCNVWFNYALPTISAIIFEVFDTPTQGVCIEFFIPTFHCRSWRALLLRKERGQLWTRRGRTSSAANNNKHTKQKTTLWRCTTCVRARKSKKRQRAKMALVDDRASDTGRLGCMRDTSIRIIITAQCAYKCIVPLYWFAGVIALNFMPEKNT